MTHQTALEVSGFVAVDVSTLGQTVNHAHNFRQKLFSLSLLFQLAQVLDGRAGRFFVVAVLQTTLVVLADTK